MQTMRTTDQPADLGSLSVPLSVAVWLMVDNDMYVPRVGMSDIQRLLLASVTVQSGLSLTWSHNSKDRFSHDMAHVVFVVI